MDPGTSAGMTRAVSEIGFQAPECAASTVRAEKRAARRTDGPSLGRKRPKRAAPGAEAPVARPKVAMNSAFSKAGNLGLKYESR